MKSKSSMFILGILILAIVGAGVYFFVIKKDEGGSSAGLVSTNTGAAQGLQNAPASQSATGSQVVTILRNLSVIKLDDSVFKNPAFALLTDVSISLPPITNQGRRNPFAPVGIDSVTPTTTTTSTNGTTGPTF
jgi:hypothetical protein